MASSLPMVRRISTSAVKPPPQPRRRCDLAQFDLIMLNFNYIQKGLLFSKSLTSFTTDHIIHTLKTSLSTALHHFYPLAGRFVTEKAYDEDGKVTGLSIYIDCNGQGAEFIHAVAENITVADVLNPLDAPDFVRLFFTLDGAINYDGHFEPLLSIQFTELVDGFFLGVCFNHAVADGTSYWNFFNTWAEIARSGGNCALSRTPLHDRLFFDNVPPVKLPFCHPDEFIVRITQPVYRERMIHFSAESIAELKRRANQECKTSTGLPLSSFQSVGALIWRCITRARRLPDDQQTSCRLAIDNRTRLQPPLSSNYFGHCVFSIGSTVTAGELLLNSLGWSASKLHETIAGHTDSVIRNAVNGWTQRPIMYNMSMFDKFCVVLGSSSRFDAYGCDFGWGKAVAARSAGANKLDGKVSFYPGWEGGGSMDLEICLLPEYMERFEADEELLSVVSKAVELDVMLRGH